MPSAFVADQTLLIHLSVEDLAMLTVLAESDGVDVEEELRSLVRARYAARFDHAGEGDAAR